jgi:dipeptidyl aminopeptidase/acylaminoacyl peptidase
VSININILIGKYIIIINNTLIMEQPQQDKPQIKYETLWKFIIRPIRDEYEDDELIESTFIYRNKQYNRKDYDLLSSQGYILKCSFIEPDDECRPTEEMPVVVYLHGNSSSRLEGQRMVDHLLKHDINVFLFDFAGSGKSEGEFISLGYHESRDVGIIIDFLEKLPGVGKIGLWGRSMGAATAMIYAHKDDRVSAVVVDSPFADFYRLAKELALKQIKLPNFLLNTALGIIKGTIKKKNGLDISKLKPIHAAEKTFTPIVFVHAMDDELIDFNHSIELSQKYAGENSFVTCHGGHNSPRPKEVISKIIKFFAKHLKVNGNEYVIELEKLEAQKNKDPQLNDEDEESEGEADFEHGKAQTDFSEGKYGA